ncbi:hypothetical protein [Amycolatopsis sp. 195334CR]|uniref:hypothetical protein n=1 Tax=Amycolatopsis sp. 195334CR TaxID=2814588 RepID=UPI001A8CF48D|nr:hypothetical protein [Amycolatopsis sp. 195334CR]MBN6034069.1 hypothetical protein [Amycolatopsis sp. 195334CR]
MLLAAMPFAGSPSMELKAPEHNHWIGQARPSDTLVTHAICECERRFPWTVP